MKILWITNIYFPALCEKMNMDAPAVGGWMYSLAKSIMANCKSLQLGVATVGNVKKMQKYELDDIVYYILPKCGDNTKYNSKLEPLWKRIVQDFQPNIVHLHGTEFAHGLAFLNACPEVKSVVSIQGLVSVIERYYYAGLSTSDIIRHFTLRDVLLCKTIFQDRYQFARRGRTEISILSKVSNIIGRTIWDKAHVLAINQHAHYYKCNEVLRDLFYGNRWKYENCTKNTLFISQGHYPLKGVHEAIEAVHLLTKDIPNLHLFVGGYNITAFDTLYQKLKLTGYGRYLRHLISRYKLQDNITFLGILNENEMLNMYLKTHIYICPSSIENSPNSLCEAQLLGVPNISAYVGGIPSLVSDKVNGLLYPKGEYEILALRIKDILLNDKYSSIDRSIAFERHDRKKNVNELISIYGNIINQ